MFHLTKSVTWIVRMCVRPCVSCPFGLCFLGEVMVFVWIFSVFLDVTCAVGQTDADLPPGRMWRD